MGNHAGVTRVAFDFSESCSANPPCPVSESIAIVRVSELSKRYRDVTALNRCTVEIQPGEVFGLLGPNGSGKSTLLRILMGMVRPTSGEATVAGRDCWRQSTEVRRRVSYLPGDARLFGWSRGRDLLELMAAARPHSETVLQAALAAADRLQLDLRRRVALMSTGMRQKLAIAITVAAETPVMILDEPTANLDPTVRMEVLKMVREAQRRGQTILFSSHVLSETEEICDRVLLLRFGDQIHLQDMSQLRDGHRIWLQPDADAGIDEWLGALERGPLADLPVHRDDDWLRVDVGSDLPRVLQWLAESPPQDVRIERLGLRTVYEEHFHRNGVGELSVEEQTP